MAEIGMDKDLMEFTERHRDELKAALAPDFKGIEERAAAQARLRRGRKARVMALRIAASFVAAVVLLNAFLLFANTEPAKAYRETLKRLNFNLVVDKPADPCLAKTRDELGKLQKAVPFNIPVPGWLPEGYDFSRLDYTPSTVDNIYAIDLFYNKKNGKPGEGLQIDITNDLTFASTKPSPGEPQWEEDNVFGMAVYLISQDFDFGPFTHATYVNKDGLLVIIGGSIDKDAVIRLIKEMK